MAGSSLLYFDYASHLRREAFQEMGGADWLGVARLEDYRLVIGVNGRPHAQPSPGSTVWGALWLLPAERLDWLDEHFGVNSGKCLRTTARIVSPAGPRGEAMLYLATAPGTGSLAPGERDEFVAAAKSIRLPGAYVAEVAKLGVA